MRKFRNAALAAATATAVALGGTAVAVAQEASDNNGSSASNIQHQIGRDIFKINSGDDTTNKAKGQDIFGEKKWDEVPFGWKLLYGTTWAMGAFALFTFLIAPIYNHFKFGPGA